MNYLGHTYLSGDNDEILVGNFIGDTVRGKKYLQYELEIQRGILLHRLIDDFTDTHEGPMHLRSLFRDEMGLCAPILVDMAIDYELARRFEDVSSQELADFASKTYATIDGFSEVIPQRMELMFFYMKQHNWLLRYAQLDGIERSLIGLSSRLSFKNNLFRGTELIQQYGQDLTQVFDSFFPDILKRTQAYIDEA